MRISAVVDSKRGTALVEFALVLPVALTLYLGSVQLQDGIACNRKVTIATRTIADLVAQNVSGNTTAAELDNSLAATTAILAPYPTAPAVIRVTEVATDYAYRTTVQWSRARNGSASTPGTTVNIPAQMRIPGTYFLYAEVKYAYKPPSNFGFIGPIAMGDSLYMLPRNSTKIDCSDC